MLPLSVICITSGIPGARPPCPPSAAKRATGARAYEGQRNSRTGRTAHRLRRGHLPVTRSRRFACVIAQPRTPSERRGPCNRGATGAQPQRGREPVGCGGWSGCAGRTGSVRRSQPYLLPLEPVTSLDGLAAPRWGQGPGGGPQPRPRPDDRRAEPVGAQGPWRRRVPDGPQVVRRPRPAREPPLRRGQRGRGGAGHVQGPGHHAGQPLPGGRGRGHRRPHPGGAGGLHRRQGQLRARGGRR